MSEGSSIVLAGATGDLGGRIAAALVRRGAQVSAPVRAGGPGERLAAVRASGAVPVEVDFADAAALARACAGAACVVSAVNGVAPEILGVQGRLLDAAVSAGVPRFVPSDFSRTRPGENRNMDLRRAFMARVDAAPVRATSVLNGAFAELLAGQAPIVLRGVRRVLCWGDPDQPLDFTAKDDVAEYAACVALDAGAPRVLRIAGEAISARGLAALMTRLEGRRWGLLRPGGPAVLGALIRVARLASPSPGAVFPAWQGMQYVRDMSSGRGKLSPLDNARYGKADWTRAEDVLAA